MKKLISLVLALVMILSVMSVAAFAETIAPTDKANVSPASINVQAVTAGADPSMVKYDWDNENAIVSVKVDWSNAEFEYSFKWNTETHKYDGSWTKNGATITVTNDSNCDVKASVAFTGESGYTDITVKDNNGSALEAKTVGAATVGEANGTQETFNIKLDGEIKNAIATASKIGTITVTIGAPDSI